MPWPSFVLCFLKSGFVLLLSRTRVACDNPDSPSVLIAYLLLTFETCRQAFASLFDSLPENNILRLCFEDLRLAISYRSSLLDYILLTTFVFPKRVQILLASFSRISCNNKRYLSIVSAQYCMCTSSMLRQRTLIIADSTDSRNASPASVSPIKDARRSRPSCPPPSCRPQ